MMGIQQGQKELFNYQVDLDRRVRSDHPLRSIREQIDFTFMRDEVKDCYGYNGNESVDPVVIMKMVFLLFYEDVASERELMRVIPERLDWMWFLGYGLVYWSNEFRGADLISQPLGGKGLRKTSQGSFCRPISTALRCT